MKIVKLRLAIWGNRLSLIQTVLFLGSERIFYIHCFLINVLNYVCQVVYSIVNYRVVVFMIITLFFLLLFIFYFRFVVWVLLLWNYLILIVLSFVLWTLKIFLFMSLIKLLLVKIFVMFKERNIYVINFVILWFKRYSRLIYQKLLFLLKCRFRWKSRVLIIIILNFIWIYICLLSFFFFRLSLFEI
jgi:hypothetical protein